MTELIFPVLWCVAQVSILSAVVLAMVRLTLRDRPEVAATSAAWAVGIVLVITLLIPVSMSRFLPAVSAGHRSAGATSPGADKSTVQIRDTGASSANLSQSESVSGDAKVPAFFVDHEALFAKLSLWAKIAVPHKSPLHVGRRDLHEPRHFVGRSQVGCGIADVAWTSPPCSRHQ